MSWYNSKEVTFVKLRRMLFVGTLMVLFLSCYHIMNQHYDELARYQYVNDDNRKVLLQNLSANDINYLIERQIKPEDFMEYLGKDHFNIRNVDWYKTIRQNENVDTQAMLSLVSKMKETIPYSQFVSTYNNYNFNQLYAFYLKDNAFIHDYELVSNPLNIKKQIPENQTLFTYIPKDLEKYIEFPSVNIHENEEGIYLRKDAGEQLKLLCEAAFDINQKTCGNMIVTQAYTSFEEQETLYEEGILKYGIDDVLNHVDYPGKSIFQLGNVIRLVPASVENEKAKDSEISIQQKWLVEKAHEFGFEFVQDSSVKQNEFILQYDEFHATDRKENKEVK